MAVIASESPCNAAAVCIGFCSFSDGSCCRCSRQTNSKQRLCWCRAKLSSPKCAVDRVLLNPHMLFCAGRQRVWRGDQRGLRECMHGTAGHQRRGRDTDHRGECLCVCVKNFKHKFQKNNAKLIVVVVTGWPWIAECAGDVDGRDRAVFEHGQTAQRRRGCAQETQRKFWVCFSVFVCCCLCCLIVCEQIRGRLASHHDHRHSAEAAETLSHSQRWPHCALCWHDQRRWGELNCCSCLCLFVFSLVDSFAVCVVR